MADSACSAWQGSIRYGTARTFVRVEATPLAHRSSVASDVAESPRLAVSLCETTLDARKNGYA